MLRSSVPGNPVLLIRTNLPVSSPLFDTALSVTTVSGVHSLSASPGTGMCHNYQNSSQNLVKIKIITKFRDLYERIYSYVDPGLARSK
jgi:hypothetical protein